MSKKLLALLLALAMMLSLLTGCGDSSAPAAEEEDAASDAAEDETAEDASVEEDASAEEEEPALTEVPAEAYDDVVAYLTDGAITKDDVVITVDGLDIPAGVYFNWLSTCYMNMAYNYYYYGATLDVTEVLDEATGTTVADYFVDQAGMLAEMYTLVGQKAREAGLTLTEEQTTELEGLGDTYTADILLYYATTLEALEQTYIDSQLVLTLRDHLYGEGGELEPTQETLADYCSASGCYNCRYILQRTDELEEDDTEGRAAKQQQAQELYDQLKEVSADELETKFAELQAEYNDDGNTDPFTFDETSSLVSGFREKLAEMEEGEIGLTEETDYGYFVILRLPYDLDSLKDTYIEQAYNTQITEWMDSADIQMSDALVNLDAVACLQRMVDLQTAANSKITAEEEAAAAEEETAADTEDAAEAESEG